LKKYISFEGMIHLTKELICGMEWESFKITLSKALSLSINLQLLAPMSLQLPISLCILDEISSYDILQLMLTSPTYLQFGGRTFIYLFIYFYFCNF